MFKRRTMYNIITKDTIVISVDGNGYKYILELENGLRDKDREIYDLRAELKSISPIIKSEHYKPALSTDCGHCKYVVLSPFNKRIIGCRKQNVCEDFEKEK